MPLPQSKLAPQVALHLSGDLAIRALAIAAVILAFAGCGPSSSGAADGGDTGGTGGTSSTAATTHLSDGDCSYLSSNACAALATQRIAYSCPAGGSTPTPPESGCTSAPGGSGATYCCPDLLCSRKASRDADCASRSEKKAYWCVSTTRPNAATGCRMSDSDAYLYCCP